MKHALMVAGAVLAVVVMAGCSAATGRATEPEPKPEPTPAPPPPGIQGSWSWSTTYINEADETYTESLLLTFTAGGRFIEAWRETDVDGNERDLWHHQGRYSIDDTTITKSFHDPYHEDGLQSGMVVKQYYWGDDEHSVLYVSSWRHNETSPVFFRMARVTDALPELAGLVGTWSEQHYNDGNMTTLWTVTIGADGSFEIKEEQPNGYVETHWGTGTVDLDNYVIDLTDVMIRNGVDGEPEVWETGVGRVAFAPAHDGRLRVSPLWDEPPYEVETGNEWPYGHYFLRVQKD
jgi:hypothetical protein